MTQKDYKYFTLRRNWSRRGKLVGSVVPDSQIRSEFHGNVLCVELYYREMHEKPKFYKDIVWCPPKQSHFQAIYEAVWYGMTGSLFRDTKPDLIDPTLPREVVFAMMGAQLWGSVLRKS